MSSLTNFGEKVQNALAISGFMATAEYIEKEIKEDTSIKVEDYSKIELANHYAEKYHIPTKGNFNIIREFLKYIKSRLPKGEWVAAEDLKLRDAFIGRGYNPKYMYLMFDIGALEKRGEKRSTIYSWCGGDITDDMVYELCKVLHPKTTDIRAPFIKLDDHLRSIITQEYNLGKSVEAIGRKIKTIRGEGSNILACESAVSRFIKKSKLEPPAVINREPIHEVIQKKVEEHIELKTLNNKGWLEEDFPPHLTEEKGEEQPEEILSEMAILKRLVIEKNKIIAAQRRCISALETAFALHQKE